MTKDRKEILSFLWTTMELVIIMGVVCLGTVKRFGGWEIVSFIQLGCCHLAVAILLLIGWKLWGPGTWLLGNCREIRYRPTCCVLWAVGGIFLFLRGFNS